MRINIFNICISKKNLILARLPFDTYCDIAVCIYMKCIELYFIAICTCIRLILRIKRPKTG